MAQTLKDTLINRFKDKPKYKPYKSLLKAFHDEIIDLTEKGFNSVEIKNHIEAEIDQKIETKKFQQALLTYKKFLKKQKSEGKKAPSPLPEKKSSISSSQEEKPKPIQEKGDDVQFNFDLKEEPNDEVDSFFQNIKKTKK